MSKETGILSKTDIVRLVEEMNQKKAKIPTSSLEKLKFEKERCEAILNRNIPMCISLYTKNIIQSDSRDRILGQLKRLSLECYWKILNIEYMKEIDKQLNK